VRFFQLTFVDEVVARPRGEEGVKAASRQLAPGLLYIQDTAAKVGFFSSFPSSMRVLF
jgi:hypothetical protein